MKTKLNIFCVLVILAMTLSAVPFVHRFCTGMAAGIATVTQVVSQEGKDSVAIETEMNELIAKYEAISKGADVTMLLDLGDLQPVTVRNKLTGKDVDVYMDGATYVNMPQEDNALVEGTCTAADILACVLGIVVLVCFIRFVVRVNKGRVFDWKNVSLLRTIGWCELACTLVTVASAKLQVYELAKLLQPEGYELSWTARFNGTDLVLGFVALALAEVFALGLKMREEQELTI